MGGGVMKTKRSKIIVFAAAGTAVAAVVGAVLLCIFCRPGSGGGIDSSVLPEDLQKSAVDAEKARSNIVLDVRKKTEGDKPTSKDAVKLVLKRAAQKDEAKFGPLADGFIEEDSKKIDESIKFQAELAKYEGSGKGSKDKIEPEALKAFFAENITDKNSLLKQLATLKQFGSKTPEIPKSIVDKDANAVLERIEMELGLNIAESVVKDATTMLVVPNSTARDVLTSLGVTTLNFYEVFLEPDNVVNALVYPDTINMALYIQRYYLKDGKSAQAKFSIAIVPDGFTKQADSDVFNLDGEKLTLAKKIDEAAQKELGKFMAAVSVMGMSGDKVVVDPRIFSSPKQMAVAQAILKAKYKNVKITIASDGSLSEEMKKLLKPAKDATPKATNAPPASGKPSEGVAEVQPKDDKGPDSAPGSAPGPAPAGGSTDAPKEPAKEPSQSPEEIPKVDTTKPSAEPAKA